MKYINNYFKPLSKKLRDLHCYHALLITEIMVLILVTTHIQYGFSCIKIAKNKLLILFS